MSGNKSTPNFFAELRRRRVLHIGGVYIAGAWLGAEILTFLLEQAMAPAWSYRLVAIVFVVGFPVAMVLAWVVQIQADGRWAIDPSGGQRKTLVGAVVLGLLATAGLSWLILPGTQEGQQVPAYQPIPNAVAFLPLTASFATDKERAIASTLQTALGSGFDQSVELILMDLSKLKEQPENLLEFGRSIKASALLTGHILQVPGVTRIEMKLLDVSRNEVTWSQTFDWNPTRIGDTGSAIANGVLETMTLPVLSRDTFSGTDNADAYDAFLLGGQRASSFNIAELEIAMEDFQRAIDLDPGYVQAYVALAETIRWYVRYRGPEEAEREALIDRAMQALERALDLDSESAAAISALGLTAGNQVLAIQAFEHALELDPGHARSYYRLGMTKLRMGEPDEAERLVRKALDLDPLNADWRNDLAGILWELQRDEEAMAEVRKSIEIEPKLPWNHHRLSRWASFGFGNLDEAMIHAREAYALDPRNGGLAWEISGLYTDLGGRAEAIAWMDLSNDLRPGNSYTWLSAYMTMAYFGEEDIALEYAKHCLELEPGNPWAARVLGFRDIEDGRPQEALERWQRAYPTLTTRESHLADDFNFCDALFYAQNLKAAGETEWAMSLTNGCLDELNRQIEESSIRQWEINDIEPELFATLGQKNETLDAMRRSIVDGHHRITPIWYSLPMFDFVRDEPEFQELMGILQSDLAGQLERVRKMECNGELAPAPGVEIERVCD